jgi:hypothetical protein
MHDSIRVLDPVAASGTPTQSLKSLADLKGKVVGFIDNSKPNFSQLADNLSEFLVNRHGVAGIVRRQKPVPGMPVDPRVMLELSQRCDAVITGLGD